MTIIIKSIVIIIIDMILFWIAYNEGYNKATQQAINILKKIKEDINTIIKINENNSIYWEGHPKILYDIDKNILVQQHNLIDGTKIMEKIAEIKY